MKTNAEELAQGMASAEGRAQAETLGVLEAAVRGFGRMRKRWIVLGGAATFVLMGPGALLAWFVVDSVVKLPAWPLLLSFVAVILLGMYGLVRHVIPPVLRRISVEREALAIEKLHGHLDNRIIGAIQLGRETAAVQAAQGRLGYSAELVGNLLADTAGQVRKLNLRGLLDLRKVRMRMVGAGLIAVAIIVSCVMFPEAIRQRYVRLQDAYAAVLDSLFPVEMQVGPGDVTMVRGKAVTLTATLKGARRSGIRLIRTEGETNKRVTEELTLAGGQVAQEMVAADSFTYQFEYGGRKSAAYKVQVGDLPDVNAINYELAFPAYTGQAPRTLSGRVPRLSALRGTGVLVSFAATTDLHPEQCYVQWQDGSKQAIATTGRFGHFSFTVAHPERGRIFVTGAYGRGFEMPEPISFEMAMQEDEAPVVSIPLKYRKFTMLEAEASGFVVPWVAEDDFGVSEVNLEYKIDTVDELLGRAPRQSTVPRGVEPAQERIRGVFTGVFKTLTPPLQPGDRITITVTAKDNNTENGPSVGRSLPLEIVVVRPDLAKFIEDEFGFGGPGAQAGLAKLKRNTDLLIEAEKTVLTEATAKAEKAKLSSRVGHESTPAGMEDQVGSYLQLLSGQK